MLLCHFSSETNKGSHMKSEATREAIFLKDYQSPSYVTQSVHLYVELKEQDTNVRTELNVLKSSESPLEDLVLYGEDQELKSITMNGKSLEPDDFKLSSSELIIKSVPNQATIEIISVIQPQNNTALSGLYKSGNMFCTQCESEGFRKITYYQDRPDVMAKFTTTIVADKHQYPVLLSNGNPIDKGDMDGGRHFVTWEDPFKKPSYLFALVAGQLACVKDTFKTMSGRIIDLEIYVEAGLEDKCQHGLDSLKKSMAWDEQTYGLEYDLDIYMIVAANDFNMGAMENKGLNVFNAKYVLANQDTATDKDFQLVEAVIGHEYFHNWTGNRVTCRDWFQLSLKEGLTVFREQQFSASTGSPTLKRIEDVSVLRSRQFPEDKGPMAHPVRPASFIEINNFYTMTIYYKGSEVIRMLHTLLGVDGFRKGIDLYFERHDGQAVTTDDFVQAMSDANKIDLTQFKRWYYQAGTPEVTAKGAYDPELKTYTLTLTQQCQPTADKSPKAPFFMPVKVGLITANGEAIQPQCDDSYLSDKTSAILILDQVTQTYEFKDVPSEPIPSLFGNFSAPVICHYPYRTNELATLMTDDVDTFNRWDAAQRLMTDVVLTQLSNNVSKPESMIEALAKVLETPSHEPALVASLLTLPSLEYLGESLKSIPILALIQAKETIQIQISEKLYDNLVRVYLLAMNKDDHALSSESIQWRTLKNTALYLLSRTHSEEVFQYCLAQLKDAKNMTDQMGALTAMNDYVDERRDECFEHFYQNWKHDPLIVNKWLGLQATQKIDKALEHVQSLIQHEGFDMRNPNKVYALIGGFCQQNPKFHQIDGKGYDFLAEKVIYLNKTNPQVASRMIEPLSFWKRYAEPHKSLMKKALEKISRSENLSPDIYEVVTKSLA